MQRGGERSRRATDSDLLERSTDGIRSRGDRDGTLSDGVRTIRVAVVDDREIVAHGIAALLERRGDIEVTSTSDADRCLEMIERHAPDVVVMDYRLSGTTGARLAEQVRSTEHPPAVVMLTASADRRVLAQALDAGCVGFVSKTSATCDLVAAVRAASIGDSFVSQDMMQHLVRLRRSAVTLDTELTDRECEILQRTADGLFPEEIAAELNLSPHTVKNQLRDAMNKLGANSRLEAVVAALRRRQITLSD